jgi:Rieske Fe-S protein
MKRRDFLKKSCITCLSFTAFSGILSSCTATKYVNGKLEKDGLRLHRDEFRVKGSTAYASCIIVTNNALKYPLCVYRLNENEYSALWMQCSHQGAELQVSGDRLQCPAHGSEFDNLGMVMNGPASTNLRKFPVKVLPNEIFIDMKRQS